jgi:hypothetical protein
VSLGHSLTIVFGAFLTILTSVIVMSFRERRIAQSMVRDDRAAQQASDARVMIMVFTAIPGGMFLTLLVAWLVFF